MDGWTETGTIAAVVAALTGAGALGVGWVYGRRADRGSAKSIRYERLREARDLVGTMRVTGDNARFIECNEAGAQLRAVLVVLGGEFPETMKLAETEWGLASYGEEGFQARVAAARAELQHAVQDLSA